MLAFVGKRREMQIPTPLIVLVLLPIAVIHAVNMIVPGIVLWGFAVPSLLSTPVVIGFAVICILIMRGE